MVGDFGWEHEGTKSGVDTVKVFENLNKFNFMYLSKRDKKYIMKKIQQKIMKKVRIDS